MDLTKLAAKPKLKKLSLDDEDTVLEFGEPLDFYIYDRQSIDNFVRLAANQENKLEEIIKIVNDMVLDKDAQPVVRDGMVLPNAIYMRVIEKVITEMGK